ncbi:MAG TPA: MFS transporter [Casimicrobiaceae bacterium]|nr:MFS transporter [Casimicrobiaceae bacterium]
MNARALLTPRSATTVLACACIVLTISMGIRHGFGLFLQPMSTDLNWGRETFALAMAVQNLMWGVTQPFTGMLADRYGTAKIVFVGAVLYVLGLFTMAHATTPAMLVLTAGVLIGTGLSGLTFSIVAGVLGRRYPPEKRSMVLGVSAAAGSFGQFAMLPATQFLLSTLGWYGALIALGVIGLAIVPLAAALVEKRIDATHGPTQSVKEALREAFAHRGYVLLTVGFFVCGFQVVFIGVHLPSFLADRGMPMSVAVMALALIGLFNIIGTFTTGWLGSRVPKRYILSTIYFARAVAIAIFLVVPLSVASVYAFAIAIGLLWLSTVPPTNGIVAQVFGVRYLSMLAGFTFLSHQLGSFLGAWLGGKLFDTLGSYDLVWYLSIALGVLAGLINLPIDEKEIRRAGMTTQAKPAA